MNSYYNCRQFKLMEERIELFEQDKINFGQLICDLRSLLDCLKEVDEEWKNNFHSEWFVLEQVYAVALNRGGIQKIENGEKFIFKSLSAMKQLLQEIKDQT